MKQSEEEIQRVTRTRKEIQSTYDRLSGLYSFFDFFEKTYKRIGLQKLDIKTGESVLEIGFGTGKCLANIAKNVGNTGRAYGIDVAEGMCRTAKSAIEESHESARTEIILGDTLHLPFREDSFDAIFMSFMLELFDTPDIPLVLKECHRTLRKGGRICVVALSMEEGNNLMSNIYAWLHDHFQSVFDCRQIFVRQSVEDAGFRTTDHTVTSLLGVPVEIVLAEKT